jgi:NAD(P)H-dependent FMN reductase
MLNLQVIICSTRPGRVGPAVGAWMLEQARAHGQFAVELVDLADFTLPIFDEPQHPRLGVYRHDHTKRWSESVKRADAFVFVTPEYNFSSPPVLLNALQFLYHEWTYKPVAFVSYGGTSGGLRGVQATKLAVTTFKMVPVVEAVTIPLIAQHINMETGAFTADAKHPTAALAMLDELHKWAVALQPMRG